MGGTFTDLVIEDESGRVRKYKHPTTPSDPLRGVFGALMLGAEDMNLELREFLGRVDTFIHGTTRSLNAILTGNTAKTALLSTRGHPDILLFREGGRVKPFDFTKEYPRPYIPRSLTFEVDERIGADGNIVRPLDEHELNRIVDTLRREDVEAIAVCLLWSIANPVHENRVGEILAAALPGVPVTLSHQLNPIVREYRRGSSTAIDASLKPLMGSYLRSLRMELGNNGFQGRLLINTSGGGVKDANDIADAPIHTINSGPAMAPVAGRYYANVDAHTDLAIVADTGGTSYDVSVVRRNRIPVTNEAWLGVKYLGHMTGFPAVDVRSVGAGGGSIAWVDDGGMLRVGPQSAGSEPGPVCYGWGGTEPTVTDACLILGYIDPEHFLGGRMKLDVEAAEVSLRNRIADPLGLDLNAAAAAVLSLATEHMVGAIDEITLNQGISPRDAVLIGGGGAAGFNTVAIARRLGCRKVVVPALGAVLSAAGALMSDLKSEYAATCLTTSSNFSFDKVNEVLGVLRERCIAFAEDAGQGAIETSIEVFAEARYPHQVWELEVPLRTDRFADESDVEALRQDFHTTHQDVFAISDQDSPIEIVSWRARVNCTLREDVPLPAPSTQTAQAATRRTAHFSSVGTVDVAVHHFDHLSEGESVTGPAIIESNVTTVVVDPYSVARRTASGSLVIELVPASAPTSLLEDRESIR
ncbi:hydantoinase/oxoprolinase family protein [Rhodococcus koreensis]